MSLYKHESHMLCHNRYIRVFFTDAEYKKLQHCLNVKGAVNMASKF